ncbi:MAG TPA: carboxymuconolactone decarboxylase family protein [Candidatus Binatia bacterium]
MDDAIYRELLAARGEGDDSGVELLRRHDPQCLAGLKAFYVDAVLGREDGALSRASKEMVIMVSAAAQRSWGGMARHLAKALDAGAGPREVLEFFEAAAINAGVPVLWRGSQALARELEKRKQPFE